MGYSVLLLELDWCDDSTWVCKRCEREYMMIERERSCNSQSSNRTEFLAFASIANFLLDGAANPNPAPLFLKSIRRLCARSNSLRRPCCKVCWPSFPSAMLAWPEDPERGWLLFLKPPIKRRNLACLSELSNCAVPHWPRFYKQINPFTLLITPAMLLHSYK